MFVGAANAALPSAGSTWPFDWPTSSPPVFLVVGSIEYLATTLVQLWPDFRAFIAAAACAGVLVSTIRMFLVSCVPNCDLCEL